MLQVQNLLQAAYHVVLIHVALAAAANKGLKNLSAVVKSHFIA